MTRDELPSVRGHDVVLAQILQNLLANAIKFHGAEPPRIHVSAETGPSAVTIGVRDNGVGIAAEDRERVFGLFERLGGATAAATGSGVGLALVKRAVEKLDGKVWVEAAPGGGSVFRFTLPR